MDEAFRPGGILDGKGPATHKAVKDSSSQAAKKEDVDLIVPAPSVSKDLMFVSDEAFLA